MGNRHNKGAGSPQKPKPSASSSSPAKLWRMRLFDGRPDNDVRKELTPDEQKVTDGWKVAQPKDDALHGKWWEIFGDPELNALEDQVNVSNQNIAMAAANFQAARATVREARSQLFPTATTNPSITASKQRAINTTTSSSGTT